MDPLLLVIFIAFLPLLIALYIRYAISPARRGIHTDLDTIHLGPSLWFWLVGLFSLIFLPSLFPRTSANITLAPRLFPANPTGFGSFEVVTIGLVIAWICSWLMGTIIAALVGVRAGLVFTAILCSAGIISDHLAAAIPGRHDELIILAVAFVQALRCLSPNQHVQVATSTTCSTCEYDLSQTPNAPCPECGTGYDVATAVFVRRVALSSRAPRITISWAVAAIVAMFAPALGLLTIAVNYTSRGIPFDAAIQLAQQYEGNTGSPLLVAWPLTLSALVASLLYQNLGTRRVWLLTWLLIPLGIAASFALQWIV